MLDPTDEEAIKASSRKTREDAADKLLEILPRKEQRAFDVFERALKKILPHLAFHLGERLNVYLTDFLKTNLTKFAVIWVKWRHAGFLSLRSSNITVTKEKEKRKRTSEEKERRRRKKKQWLHFGYCWTQKVSFGGGDFLNVYKFTSRQQLHKRTNEYTLQVR